MAAPQITSITFDAQAYAPGAVVTATVDYVPGGSLVSQSFSSTATDSATGEIGTLSASFSVLTPDPTTVAASDSGNRVWTQVSDNGSQAVFTATA